MISFKLFCNWLIHRIIIFETTINFKLDKRYVNFPLIVFAIISLWKYLKLLVTFYLWTISDCFLPFCGCLLNIVYFIGVSSSLFTWYLQVLSREKKEKRTLFSCCALSFGPFIYMYRFCFYHSAFLCNSVYLWLLQHFSLYTMSHS